MMKREKRNLWTDWEGTKRKRERKRTCDQDKEESKYLLV